MNRSKKWCLEWVLFLGENGKLQYNKPYKSYPLPCKRSFRAVVVSCPHYLFPPFQKVRELGFKMGEPPVLTFPCRGSMIPHVGRQGVSA